VRSTRAITCSVSGREGFQVGEHEFGPAEHSERAVVDITPGEIDESGPWPALHRSTAEVQPVLADNNVEWDRPRRRLGVAAHQLSRLLADLNADMDVVVALVAGLPHAPRQVMTPDMQQHRHRP